MQRADDEKIMFIYKIDHYYSLDHDKYALLIKSDIEVQKMIKILATIQFKFEDLVNDSIAMDEKHILLILKEFYGVTDVREQYQRYLPYTHLKNSEWETFNIFNIKGDSEDFKIIQIDLYEARESYCGKRYVEFMPEVLPNADNFEFEIKNIKNFYPGLNSDDLKSE